MNSLEKIKTELSKHNIKLSYQRLKIVEYLIENHIHPSVDTIYNDLKETIPTLSRTTIYNTVNSLVDAGLLMPIYTSTNELHYDIVVDPHAHFECNRCHKLINFDYDFDSLIVPETLKNCIVTSKTLLYFGICEECRHKAYSVDDDDDY